MGIPVTLHTNHRGYVTAQQYGLHNIVYSVSGSESWRRFGSLAHGFMHGLDSLLRGTRGIRTNGLIYSASNSWGDVFTAQRVRRLNPNAIWISNVKAADSKYPVRSAWSSVANMQIARNADLVFALTAVDKTRLAHQFDDRAYALRLGIDAAGAGPKRRPRKKYDACCVVAGETLSGLKMLAEAWRHVNEYRPGSKLAVMAAADTRLPFARRIFAASGANDSVTWLIDPDEKTREKTLLAGRVYIAPFNDANMTFVGEAMAMGLPVIGFDLPGLKFDYEGGRMTAPAGDWASLGHLLIYILANRAVYLRLKKEAVQTVAGRDWRDCAGQALAFIGERGPKLRMQG